MVRAADSDLQKKTVTVLPKAVEDVTVFWPKMW